MSVTKKVIATPDAPAAIGPYSQAIRAGDFVFLSGQIPLDPATGAMVEGDIEAQTRQVMKNLGAVLAAAGSSFDRVVRATIYLVDLGDFAKVNAIYGAQRGPLLPEGHIKRADGIAPGGDGV